MQKDGEIQFRKLHSRVYLYYCQDLGNTDEQNLEFQETVIFLIFWLMFVSLPQAVP